MKEIQTLKWSVERRFEFIEWRLYWAGRVNRSDVEDKFDVSTPQATNDFRAYQELHPENIFYAPSERSYLPTEHFKPAYLPLSADRYLLQLDAILNGAIAPSVTWFGSVPPATVVEDIVRSVRPATLRSILRAIEQQHELRIDYQSLTKRSDRVIAPHAIAFDGHRWHARAWCAKNREFRDFVLSRIVDIAPRTQPSASNPNHDREWTTFVELKIIPHPKLSEAQKNAIALDYGLQDGFRYVKTRAALAFYLIKSFNLDLREGQISPERQQICLENYDEVEATRARAKEEARSISSPT
ncbi:MAG: WYL domain-containing protein [Rhizomicrobium sp.]